jgi:hypothetical protein
MRVLLIWNMVPEELVLYDLDLEGPELEMTLSLHGKNVNNDMSKEQMDFITEKLWTNKSLPGPWQKFEVKDFDSPVTILGPITIVSSGELV